MKHAGKEVTWRNYQQVYSTVGEDIQEEVYLALGDNLDIDEYVSEAGRLGIEGALWLHQVRRGLHDGVDEKYFAIPSARVLYRIRMAYLRGMKLDIIDPLISRGISESAWLMVVNLILDGYGDRVSSCLKYIPSLTDDLLDNVNTSIRGGYKVEKVLSVKRSLTKEEFRVLNRLLVANRWNEEVERGEWSVSDLENLSWANDEVYGVLFRCGLTPKISGETLHVMIGMATAGTQEEVLKACIKGDYPLWQLDKINQAASRGYNVGRLLNRMLTPRELEDVLVEEEMESNRRDTRRIMLTKPRRGMQGMGKA